MCFPARNHCCPLLFLSLVTALLGHVVPLREIAAIEVAHEPDHRALVAMGPWRYVRNGKWKGADLLVSQVRTALPIQNRTTD